MEIPEVVGRPYRHGFGVTAIMKNEDFYVAEWIEFYLVQGARRIIVYDNGSTDRTAEIVLRYGHVADCILVPWRTFTSAKGMTPNVQSLAYAHALANFGADLRWMAFLDVDEFLFATRDVSLQTRLLDFNDRSSISIPWTNFGPNGHSTRQRGLVIENYTECVTNPVPSAQTSLLRYKTIVDPTKVGRMGTHFFRLRGDRDVFYNEAGEACRVSDQRVPAHAVTDALQLNHYFTRSLEEMQAREAKGRASRNGAVVTNHLARRYEAYRQRTGTDEKILRFVPAVKRQMLARRWAPAASRAADG